MKTIKKGEEIKRVDNESADRKVKNEGFEFVPKKTWKDSVRDIKAAVAQEKVEKPVKEVKISKKDKK